jgi:hypothetical protein
MGYEDAVVFENPDFDAAIIGVTTEGCAVYDYDQMVSSLVEEDDMEELEAMEFIDYNTLRALPYAGEMAPVVVYLFRKEDMEDT